MTTSTEKDGHGASGPVAVIAPGGDGQVGPAPSDAIALGPSPGRWTRARRRIAQRQALWLELGIMVLLYFVYDAGRGLVVGGAAAALSHARSVATLEQNLHVFIEPAVQSGLSHVPGLTGLFGIGYATFHLGVTGAVLLWLYFCHPSVFPRVRTLLIVSSLVALVGFTLYPAAPPRLAGVGLADTLHLGRATTESGALHWLYNPYAAIPSLHMAFAVIAGGSIMFFARHRVMRLVGLFYPFFIAAEVIATGNHFLFDVVTGVVLVVVAGLATVPIATDPADGAIRHAVHEVGARTLSLARPGPGRR